MSEQLSREQLIQARESLRDLVWKIHAQKNDLLDEGKIDRDQFNKISRREMKIRNLIDEITVLIFQSIVTDLQEPGQKIIAATNKVNSKIEELQEINQILARLELVINLFSTVTLAVGTGNPALIANIVGQITAL
jgi:hypothetical protein